MALRRSRRRLHVDSTLLVSRLTPTDVGWFSHDDPFELDVHSFRYADNARRFWGGTPSVAPYVAATVGLRNRRDRRR